MQLWEGDRGCSCLRKEVKVAKKKGEPWNEPAAYETGLRYRSDLGTHHCLCSGGEGRGQGTCLRSPVQEMEESD